MRAQIYLRVGMNDKFIIPLNGLAAGETTFFWQAGKEFFDSFENSEILDAHLDTDVRVEKSGRYIGVDCDVRGEIKVECDRCLDELELPVDVEIMLSVKYGDEESSDEPQEGEREVLFVPENENEETEIVLYGEFTAFNAIQKWIEENGYELVAAEFTRLPNVDLKVLEGDAKADIEKLIERIEEDDDVQNVYTTMQP